MDGAAIAQALERQSWCVLPGFLDAALTAQLEHDCRERDAARALAPAATGRGTGRQHSALRGDRTQWFEATALSAAQMQFWVRMDALRVDLNRRLMLGLAELEAHYALYPPGTGYARHRDRFRDDDARVVSAVAYLNHDWHDADGGALRLHLPQGPFDVMPQGGTLALFLSAEIEHEVLPATRERLSIAGTSRRY